MSPPQKSAVDSGSPMRKRKRSASSKIDIWCEGDSTCSGSSSDDDRSRGIDLTKGFKGIGAGEATNDKENMGHMGPPPKKMAKTAGRSGRTALGTNMTNVS